GSRARAHRHQPAAPAAGIALVLAACRGERGRVRLRHRGRSGRVDRRPPLPHGERRPGGLPRGDRHLALLHQQRRARGAPAGRRRSAQERQPHLLSAEPVAPLRHEAVGLVGRRAPPRARAPRRPAGRAAPLKRVLRVLLRAAGIYLALLITLAVGTATYYSLYYQTNGSLVVDGKERQYLLHVSKKYDRSKPAPLVISLHGAMNWPGFQRDTTRWNGLADEQGFLVVYPAGTGFG